MPVLSIAHQSSASVVAAREWLAILIVHNVIAVQHSGCIEQGFLHSRVYGTVRSVSVLVVPSDPYTRFLWT